MLDIIAGFTLAILAGGLFVWFFSKFTKQAST